ncbi:unnamed protein product [Cylindrotheca closterium]|uniref:Uncharacterized protein n=1 Tax=Cylindrotheca closterium TaxID=2856 RepID=A0AAD2CRD2_9STRA|nr:unnamed protein product [Cylindrotheca closterium]
MSASSSYFTSNRGQQQQPRSRRNLQQTAAPSMGSRAPRNLVAARISSNHPRGSYSQQTSNFANHVSRHRRHNLPRTVTPTNNAAPPSWEDFDEDPYGGSNSFPRSSRSRTQSSDRSVVSTSYVEMEEEIPMDELIEDSLSVQSMPPIRRTHVNHRRARSGSNNDWADANSYARSSSSIDHNSAGHNNNHRRNQSMDWGSTELGQIGLHRRTHSNLSQDWADDVSSLGGVEDRPNGIGDIIRALKHRSKSRPSHLTAEERVLWESIQISLNSARNEQMENKRALERLLQDAARREAQIERKLITTQRQLVATNGKSKSNSKSTHMEVQVRDLETTLKSKQADHEREVRAMQRVLAAMTEEREQETGNLKKEIERLTEKYEGKDGCTDSTASETSSFLEAQLAGAKVENQKLVEEINPLRTELETARDEIANLKYRGLDHSSSSLDRRGIPRSQSMTPPRYGVSSSNSFDAESASSAESVETLQRSLAETTYSLENAKKIIASLENANNALAVDLRAKLKAKEQELHIAQTESADFKHRLDILATELRALQVRQGDSDRSQRGFKGQIQDYQDLVDLLEKSVSGLQSASVVHEVSAATGQPDLSNVDQIGEILNETLAALRSTLDKASSSKEESKNSSEITIDGEKVSMKQMKDLLKKQHEQMKRLRKQVDEKNEGLESIKMMRTEIQSLKEKCSSNEKLLTKKDRELAVLRSSLPEDDNNSRGGYISDDESGDEDEAASGTILPPPSMNYPTQQSLSNILQQIGRPGNSSNNEVETLKEELLKALGEKELASKALKEEKESLANAKMIISSLENANKRMTADLRLRLHECNSEIVALTDKSKENEHTASELREEVERLKKEKAEHEAEINRRQGVDHPQDESADPKPEVEEKKEETVAEQV